MTPTEKKAIIKSFERLLPLDPEPPVPQFAVDPRHNVRTTDPDTSHKAAYEHPEARKTDRVRCRETLLAAGPNGLTDNELAVLVGRQLNSANKRRGELRDHGFVVDSGRRRKTPTGSDAIVWIAVEFRTATEDPSNDPTSSPLPGPNRCPSTASQTTTATR